MSTKTAIQSSVASIERLGAKLTPTDFKDFLFSVYEAFPSSSPEAEFLKDLVATTKPIDFVKKVLSLFSSSSPIQVTDQYEHGFLWELLDPTELGTTIFRKLEEIDSGSAGNLYDYVAYVSMTSSNQLGTGTGANQDDPDALSADGAESGTDPVADPVDGAKPNTVPVTDPEPALGAGGEPDVDATVADPLNDEEKKMDKIHESETYRISLYTKGSDGASALNQSASNTKLTTFVRSASAEKPMLVVEDIANKISYFLPSGRNYGVNSNGVPVARKDVIDPILSNEEIKAVLTEKAPTHIIAQDNKQFARTANMMAKDHGKFDVPQTLAKFPIGSFVMVTDGDGEKLKGKVMEVTEAGVRVNYKGGGFSIEHPNALSPAGVKASIDHAKSTFILLSNLMFKDGVATFRLVSFRKAPTNDKYLFRSISASAIAMPESEYRNAKLPLKASVLYGKRLDKVMSSLETLEPKSLITEAKVSRFNKTFVTQKRSFVVKSSKGHFFAVTAPVEYVKASKAYTLFRKMGAVYVSQSGHQFPVAQASKYGKPVLLMVSNKVRKFFSVKSSVKVNPLAVVERQEAIHSAKIVASERRALALSIRSSRKALVSLTQSHRALATDIKARDITIEQQAKSIVSLRQSVLEAKTNQQAITSSAEPKKDASKLVNFLASRMNG